MSLETHVGNRGVPPFWQHHAKITTPKISSLGVTIGSVRKALIWRLDFLPAPSIIGSGTLSTGNSENVARFTKSRRTVVFVSLESKYGLAPQK